MAVPIQLALQGGGAKITYLIAALAAVQELERQEKVVVTRIAGTSAGAIVGALYAAHVDLETARQVFMAKRDKFLRAFPPDIGMTRAGYMMVRRQPFWDVAPLREFLQEQFKEITTLGQLKIPMLVLASDLTNMQPCVYESGSEPLISALLDSAGIPFFFRTVPGGGADARVIVDGGICENLPSHYLKHSPEKGEVLGVTFNVSRAAQNPHGILGYAQALLETAMNTAVLRAQLELRLNTFTIHTKAGTFDFPRAFDRGLDVEYDHTKTKAAEFLVDYLQRHEKEAQALIEQERTEAAARIVRTELPKARLEEVFAALRSMYQLQQEPQKFDFLRIRLEVTARSQLAKGATPDELMHEVTFRATTAPISCYKIKLSSSESAICDTQCEVFDVNGEPVPVDIVPISESGANVRDYLVFFRTPIQPDDPRSPVRLRIRDTVTSAVRLRELGRDELLTRAMRADRPIGLVEVVAHFPKALGNVLVAPYDDALPGGRMTAADLSNYDAPAGFSSVGWKGHDVPPNTLFGCILVMP